MRNWKSCQRPSTFITLVGTQPSFKFSVFQNEKIAPSARIDVLLLKKIVVKKISDKISNFQDLKKCAFHFFTFFSNVFKNFLKKVPQKIGRFAAELHDGGDPIVSFNFPCPYRICHWILPAVIPGRSSQGRAGFSAPSGGQTQWGIPIVWRQMEAATLPLSCSSLRDLSRPVTLNWLCLANPCPKTPMRRSEHGSILWEQPTKPAPTRLTMFWKLGKWLIRNLNCQ